MSQRTSLGDYTTAQVARQILAQNVAQGVDLNGIIDQLARPYLKEAIQMTGGNKARAAKRLDFGNATTLTNWLKRHGVEP